MGVSLWIQLGVVVAILAALWVLADAGTYRGRALRAGRRLGLVDPAPPRPTGPPVEQIAADVERIRRCVRSAPPGMPVAQRRGWLQAYDDVLVEACRALGLEQALESLPPGSLRELERERVERLLVRAGLLPGRDAER
ncbi:hypothetical protein [Nocardioides lijunqiniae]|uniref:hypothetical protein n=1 Tax=Nocardioides lijunqiniae TaxID=2760832 RepID=UPI00187866FB|nr:hypothetical protein [Nocardioides lijunqiniae]